MANFHVLFKLYLYFQSISHLAYYQKLDMVIALPLLLFFWWVGEGGRGGVFRVRVKVLIKFE